MPLKRARENYSSPPNAAFAQHLENSSPEPEPEPESEPKPKTEAKLVRAPPPVSSQQGSGITPSNPRLMVELKQAMKRGFDKTTGITMCNIGDATNIWSATKEYWEQPGMSNNYNNIQMQLKEMGLNKITFNLKFPDDYPFSPPFVFVSHPHIINSCVFPRGGICQQMLSRVKGNGWTPLLNAYSLMISLTSRIETYPGVGVQTGVYDAHTEAGARYDFETIERAHASGWDKSKSKS